MPNTALALAKKVDSIIHVLRGQKVILDADLAALYGVSVKRLNEQIKRNAARFPSDFAFRLAQSEYRNLKSQFVTSSSGHGGRRKLPWAFTEHGAIMAANVLNSDRAIKMSIFVVRAFLRMREALIANRQILAKLSELERRIDSHDAEIQELLNAIRELTAPLPANGRRIGFELPSGQIKALKSADRARVRGSLLVETKKDQDNLKSHFATSRLKRKSRVQPLRMRPRGAQPRGTPQAALP